MEAPTYTSASQHHERSRCQCHTRHAAPPAAGARPIVCATPAARGQQAPRLAHGGHYCYSGVRIALDASARSCFEPA